MARSLPFTYGPSRTAPKSGTARAMGVIMNVRTKGFCSALLRCGEIKLIAEKREYAISDLIANIARTKRRRTKFFGTQSSFTL